MSQLSDAIAATKTSADAMVTRVTTDLTDLHAQIVALQAQVDSGGATPADLQALADLKAQFDALDPTNTATLAGPAASKLQAAVKKH